MAWAQRGPALGRGGEGWGLQLGACGAQLGTEEEQDLALLPVPCSSLC